MHEADVALNPGNDPVTLSLQQHVLAAVGLQYLRPNVLTLSLNKAGTFLAGQLTVSHQAVHQNLDVDLSVRGFYTGGVINGVGVDDDTLAGCLDTSQLGEAEVAAFTYDTGTQICAVHADGVIGFIAYFSMSLGRPLDIGADTTVVEQVYGCLEDG